MSVSLGPSNFSRAATALGVSARRGFSAARHAPAGDIDTQGLLVSEYRCYYMDQASYMLLGPGFSPSARLEMVVWDQPALSQLLLSFDPHTYRGLCLIPIREMTHEAQ